MRVYSARQPEKFRAGEGKGQRWSPLKQRAPPISSMRSSTGYVVEEENQELKSRVASALDEIKGFHRRAPRRISKSARADFCRPADSRTRRARWRLPSPPLRQLFNQRPEHFRIFAEIDKYLDTYRVEDTLSRLHTRTQLADARDDFMCMFHDSIRGTKLGNCWTSCISCRTRTGDRTVSNTGTTGRLLRRKYRQILEDTRPAGRRFQPHGYRPAGGDHPDAARDHAPDGLSQDVTPTSLPNS